MNSYQKVKHALGLSRTMALLKAGTICTPFPLIEEIVDKLPIQWDNPKLRFLDPACGRGAFLLVIKQKLLQSGHSEKHIVENMLYGIDIEQQNAMVAAVVVDPSGQYKNNIECADTLKKEFKMKFDVVIGNPPYQLPESQVARRTTKKNGQKKLFSGRLWETFVKEFLMTTPVAAMIMPSSFLNRKRDTITKLLLRKSAGITYIIDTTKHFDIALPTCAIIRDATHLSGTTTVVPADGIGYESDIEDVVSLATNGKAAHILAKVKTSTSIANTIWGRDQSVSRSDDVYAKHSKWPIVKVVGPRDNPLPEIGYLRTPITSRRQCVNKFKVVANVNASDTDIGALKIVSAGHYVTGSIAFFKADTLATAQHIKQYLETHFVRFIVMSTRVNNTNTKNSFVCVPHVDFSRSWTDEQLYKHFKLTKEEIKLIEDTVK